MLPPGADQLDEDRAHPVYDENGERVVRVRKSNTGMFTQLISDARAAEWEHVKPGDEDRLFYKMAWWKKVIVMAGGPTVNLLIAFLIFLPVFALYGNPTDVRIQSTVDEVAPCIVPAAEDGRACTPEELREAPTPASQAGLEPGDRFVSFNGDDVTSWEQLQQAIRANDDGEAVMVVERDGELLTLTTNTTVELRPTSMTDDTLVQVGFLGVVPVAELGTGGPVYTLEQMGGMTVDTVQAMATLPAKVWNVAQAIVGVEERDRDGPVSIVGGGRLAGETVSHQDVPGAGEDDLPADADRGLQLLHRHVQLHPAAPARRRPHRGRPLRSGTPRARPAPPSTRPRVRRRGQAAPGRLRDGVGAAGARAGADRRRPRRTGPPGVLTSEPVSPVASGA